MGRLRMLALVPFVFLAIACGNDFPPSEIVEKPRPLASSITIEGDTTHRAAPKPGETATFEMLVANPGPRVGWSFAFVVCPAVFNSSGIYFCDTSVPWWPIALNVEEAAPTTPPFPNPTITFTVPDERTLAGRDMLMVQGAMCPGDLEHALIDALVRGDISGVQAVPNPCVDKSANGLFVSAPFPLQLEGDPLLVNHTPIIESLTYAFDPNLGEQPWTYDPPGEAPQRGCKGGPAPQITETSLYGSLTARLNPGSRETYADPSPIPGDPPTITTDNPRLVGYSDGGDFDIRFDNQLSDGQPLTLTWQPPQPKVPADGTLVRFWILVHDNRSQNWMDATSWVTRALCIVPP